MNLNVKKCKREKKQKKRKRAKKKGQRSDSLAEMEVPSIYIPKNQFRLNQTEKRLQQSKHIHILTIFCKINTLEIETQLYLYWFELLSFAM